jgi:hypothetical protein
MLSLKRAVVLLPLTLLQQSNAISSHFQFNKEESGVISLKANAELRLNVQGGDPKPGDPLVLWPCHPQAHEVFKFEDGLVKLQNNQNMCLNAAGGLNAGTKIVTWPCAQAGDAVAHEQFKFENGRISTPDGKMCFNVKEGNFNLGTNIILWPCSDNLTAYTANEQFRYQKGRILLAENDKFHLNVAGGDLSNSSQVVLWTCQPSKHEIFFFDTDDRIKLRSRPDLCLHAQEGLFSKSPIIVWPCSEEPQENELFRYHETQYFIYAKKKPEFAFNVEEANLFAGGRIILYRLHYDEEL